MQGRASEFIHGGSLCSPGSCGQTSGANGLFRPRKQFRYAPLVDRFHLMDIFVRVAEAGSFTRAAEGLGVSRSSVSTAVQQLETHLGVRLLHRTTRRVTLTTEGEVYHRRCLAVLSEIEATEQLVMATSEGLSGTLSLDAPTRIAHRIIIPALPEFLSRHPGLAVRLGASDRSIDLLEHGVDAVVRVGVLPDSSLVARPIGSLVQVNCASPSYLSERGTPETLDDLDEHVVVHYSPGFSDSPEWDFVADGESRARPMRSIVTVDSAEAYVACCLAGLGLIQVPAYDVQEHIQARELVTVLGQLAPPPLPVSIVFPTRKHVPSRVREFADWVATLFERQGLFARGFEKG